MSKPWKLSTLGSSNGQSEESKSFVVRHIGEAVISQPMNGLRYGAIFKSCLNLLLQRENENSLHYPSSLAPQSPSNHHHPPVSNNFRFRQTTIQVWLWGDSRLSSWFGWAAESHHNQMGYDYATWLWKGHLDLEVEAAVISKSRPIRPWSCGKQSIANLKFARNQPFWFQLWIVIITIVCLRYMSTQHELNTFLDLILLRQNTYLLSHNTVLDKISSSPQYCLRQST